MSAGWALDVVGLLLGQVVVAVGAKHVRAACKDKRVSKSSKAAIHGMEDALKSTPLWMTSRQIAQL